jgi:hypothetical protein
MGMKLGWIFAAIVCAPVLALGQSAHATYAKNGVLIGLSDLAPLRSCAVRSLEGKVKTVKHSKTMVKFDLKSDDDERMTFQFPLSRLAAAEQVGYRKDFLHKGLRLRASGYACRSDDDALETISVERVY